MKKLMLEKKSLSLGTMALAILAAGPASADLVYETELSAPGQGNVERNVKSDAVVFDAQEEVERENAAVSTPASEPAVDEVTADEEQAILTPAQLMRLKREQIERKNDDRLQVQLENARIRNERELGDRLDGGFPLENRGETADAVAAPAPLEQEVVSSSLVDASSIPAAQASAQVSMIPVQPLAAPVGVSVEQVAGEESASDETVRFAVTPRIGMSNMVQSYGYIIQPRYTAGLDLGVAVSDHVRFDVGYAFSEYGVSLASTNPWVWGLQNFTGTRESLAMKQNVVDAGLKLHVLGSDSRVRPYLGGGGAYAKSFINYDQRIINALWTSGLQSMATDYILDSFLGFVTTGMDVRITRSVSVGANARYYAVLSSRENQSLNNAAIGGYYPGYFGYGVNNLYYGADLDKQILGGTLSRAAFYTITGDVTFTF